MHGILKPTKNSSDAYSTISRYDDDRRAPAESQSQRNDQPYAWGHWNAESYYQSQAAKSAADAMNDAPMQSQYSYGSTSSYATPSQGNSTSQQSPVTTQTSYTTPSQTESYSQSQGNSQYATPTQGSASSSNVYEGYAPAASTYAYPGSAPASTSAPTSFSQNQSQEDDSGTPSQTSSARRTRTATVYGLKYASQAMDLDAMISALRADIEASAESPIPECTTTELSLHGSAFVPLLRPTIGPYAEGGAQDLPEEFKVNFPSQEHKDQNAQSESQKNNADGSSSQPPPPKPSLLRLDPLKDSPQATVDSTLTVSDSKVRAIVQRAASRGLVQHIENLDGFRYSFNNAWSAKDEDGLRFSYICQDSMQNKDRHANGFARTQKANQGDAQSSTPPVVRGPRKATYDCKGTVSVKFSAKLRAAVIQYRHYAIHGTVADRKPLPRGVSSLSGIRGMKRKRHSDGAPPPRNMMPPPPPPPPPPREPSLFELLQQSAVENAQKDGHLGDASSPWWGST